jgi:hypothetical protein
MEKALAMKTVMDDTLLVMETVMENALDMKTVMVETVIDKILIRKAIIHLVVPKWFHLHLY